MARVGAWPEPRAKAVVGVTATKRGAAVVPGGAAGRGDARAPPLAKRTVVAGALVLRAARARLVAGPTKPRTRLHPAEVLDVAAHGAVELAHDSAAACDGAGGAPHGVREGVERLVERGRDAAPDGPLPRTHTLHPLHHATGGVTHVTGDRLAHRRRAQSVRRAAKRQQEVRTEPPMRPGLVVRIGAAITGTAGVSAGGKESA